MDFKVLAGSSADAWICVNVCRRPWPGIRVGRRVTIFGREF